MDLFVKHMSVIKRMANRYAIMSGGKWEVDELINGAYIKFDVAITNKPSLIKEKFCHKNIFLNRVKLDMIDFMRDESRFRQKKRWEETGRWRWPEFKVTSYQQSPDEVIFEPSCSDSGQGKSDSKSMVKDLLLNTELTNDEWFIIQQYFYDERTLKEIGQVIGGSESTISQKKTKICKKLLTSAERMCMI